MYNATGDLMSLDASDIIMVDRMLPTAQQVVATSVLAPAFSGFSLQLFLAGIALSNASEYLRSGLYSRDPLHIRVIIVTVVILVLWCSGFSLYEILRWGVSQERSAEAIGATSRVDALLPLPGALLGFLVQGVLLKRAYGLFELAWARRVWISAASFMMLASTFGALETVVMGYAFNTGRVGEALPFTYSQAIATWLWPAMLLDVTITTTLCVLTLRRIEGFNDKMDSVLARIARLSIETALPTALIATAGAVVSSSFPTNDLLTLCIPFGFWVPLPSLYAISLFATLSARDRLRTLLRQTPTTPRIRGARGSDLSPCKPTLRRIVSLAFSPNPQEKEEHRIVLAEEGLGEWRREVGSESLTRSVARGTTGSRVSDIHVSVEVEEVVETPAPGDTMGVSDPAAEAGFARRGSLLRETELARVWDVEKGDS